MPFMSFTENLMVNELIKINTSAEKELIDTQPVRQLIQINTSNSKWYPYDIVFTRLSENLQKRIDN